MTVQLVGDKVDHPAYGFGEIVCRYPDGFILARFGDLPGGTYLDTHGPVIMAVVCVEKNDHVQ